MGIIDEWAYHRTNEAMDFLTGAWFASIWDISTIQEGMPHNEFYKRWSSAYIKTKQYEPIDEIIHKLWIKYGFNKCTKGEDYLEMAKQWVFDKCRLELFQTLPNVGLKYTYDMAEHYTEEERDLAIQTAIDRKGINYAMAEFFAELTGSAPAIRYQQSIVPEKPDTFEKVFIGYDEAEDYDKPWVAVVWVVWGKAYVIHGEYLPEDITDRYKELKSIVQIYQWRSKEVIIFADCTRWWAIKREIFDRVWQLNYAVKWTHGKGKDSVNISKDYLHMGKAYITNLINDELFLKNKIFIRDWIDSEHWLLKELSKFVRLKDNVYWGINKAKDDQVCWMLMAAYWAYEHIKQRQISNWWFDDLDEDEVEWRYNQKKRAREEAENAQKLQSLMNNIW